MVESGKVSEAYDQLFEGSQIPIQKPQAVDALKRQTSSGLPMYGKIIGIEKLRDEKIGSSVVRLVKKENFGNITILQTIWIGRGQRMLFFLI